MKKRAFIITACVLIIFAVEAILLKGGDGGLQQGGDWNKQSFFTARVIEAHEEYLILEVFDTGNSHFSEGAKVEVSTDVEAAAGCPEFVADECAKVLMASNKGDNPPGRLEALSIYKTDETGKVIAD